VVGEPKNNDLRSSWRSRLNPWRYRKIFRNCFDAFGQGELPERTLWMLDSRTLSSRQTAISPHPRRPMAHRLLVRRQYLFVIACHAGLRWGPLFFLTVLNFLQVVASIAQGSSEHVANIGRFRFVRFADLARSSSAVFNSFSKRSHHTSKDIFSSSFGIRDISGRLANTLTPPPWRLFTPRFRACQVSPLVGF
jgi:hypothetical protein